MVREAQPAFLSRLTATIVLVRPEGEEDRGNGTAARIARMIPQMANSGKIQHVCEQKLESLIGGSGTGGYNGRPTRMIGRSSKSQQHARPSTDCGQSDCTPRHAIAVMSQAA